MTSRIEALESNAINKVESIRIHGDIKRKIDCQEEDYVKRKADMGEIDKSSDKKEKIDDATLVLMTKT